MQTTIEFVDGRTFEVPKSWIDQTGSAIKGMDSDGNVFTMDSTMAYYNGEPWFFGLTACHGATFTGTIGGVGCRSCYEIDPGGSDTPWGPVTLRVGVVLPPPPASK